MQQHYDLIIGGGAMTGLTLALAVQTFTEGRLKIAVVEKYPNSPQQGMGFDQRCVALSDGTCRKLNRIVVREQETLWQQIKRVAEPIKQVHISERGQAAIVEINATELRLAQLGVVVSLQQVGEILTQAIAQHPSIDVFCPKTIQQLQVMTDQIKVTLSDQQSLTASLLVAADGSGSEIAKLAGICTEQVHHFQQSAIIANVMISVPHQGRAFERLTPQGPIALLPLAEKMMSLVFCTHEPERLLTLNDQQFLQQLQQVFGWRLGQFTAVSQRYVYPLTVKRSSALIGERLALVGNAAQTLHPVAGQGFNLGIRDVMTLAEIIANTEHLGSAVMLQQYQAARLPDQQQIIDLTSNIVQIFSNDLLPLRLGRQLGLLALNHSQILRHTFVQPTLGRV